MAETDVTSGETAAIPPAPRRRKRGLILKIVAIVVVLLILVVLLAPTLIGSGPVVSIIVGQVNRQLNGKVEIGSLSLGWFTGVKVDGVRVLDASNTQIAKLDHVVVPLPLWKAVIGHLALGDVVIDGLTFDAKYDSQGRLNFSQLSKPAAPTSSSAAPPSTRPPAEKSNSTKLPDISVNIKISNCHGTVTKPGKPTVYLTKLDGEIKIPDIHQNIADQIDAAIKVGDQSAGTLTAAGTIEGLSDDLTSLASMRAHQSLDVQGLDLQAVMPFVGDTAGVDTLQGLLDIHLSADVNDRSTVMVDASITGKSRVAIGGKILKGDTFSTETFVAQIPNLEMDLSNGLDQWHSARINVGAAPGASPILFKIDQGQVTLLMSLIPQSLLNYFDNQKPGSPGQLVLNSNFDLGKIIPQLKNTLPPPAGVSINNGSITEMVTIAITADKIDLSTKTDLTQITGTQTLAGASPAAITIDPVHFSASASGIFPNLQNIDVNLQSKFANGKFQGNTLSDLNGTLTADLKVLQSQISQFIDLKKKNVGGTLAINIKSSGQLLQAPYQGGIVLDVKGTDLVYADDGQSIFNQPSVDLNVQTDLQGSAQNAVEQVKKLTATLKTADAATPDLSAEVTGVTLAMSEKSPLDKLQSAHWQVSIRNVKPLMDLAGTAPAKADAKTPPPLKFTGGSIALAGDLSHDGSALKLNMSQVSAQNLAFTRGDISYAFKPVNLNLIATVSPEQMKVTQLTGDLGIATLSMPTPIVVSQLSTTPIANGGIKLVGNLTDLTQLLAALQGEKASAYPYRGDYTLTENIGSQQSTIALKGGLQIAKFQSFNGDTVTFSEDLLNVANDIALTTEGDDQSVAINSVTAAMQSSGAVNIALTGGTIQHLKSTRELQLHPKLDYDLTKLWPIVQPMMGDKYKTLKIAGHYQKQFNITGSYPANQPSTIAIKPLHVDGDLAVESFDYSGLTMQNFILPFNLDNGQLVTLYANKSAAAAATANGGTLDLSNLTVDLTQDPPRLTTPANKTLVNNLTINPLFSDSFLAKVINNPLFAGAKDASGLIALTIDDCTNLPMGNLVTLPSPDNTGKIDLHFSITKLHVGLATDALQSVLKENSFEANVNDATVSMAKGISTQHIKFVTGSYTLGFDGSVRLKDQAFIPMTLTFPFATIAAKTHLTTDKNVLGYLPDSLAIPVEGTVSAPKYRFEKVIPKALADAGAKAIAGGLLGGNKKDGGGNNSDPLGGLLNKLEKKKK